jgi:hypothetical protein
MMRLLALLWCHYGYHVGSLTVDLLGRSVVICDHCDRPFLAGVAAR